jgi:hypothetical protein
VNLYCFTKRHSVFYVSIPCSEAIPCSEVFENIVLYAQNERFPLLPIRSHSTGMGKAWRYGGLYLNFTSFSGTHYPILKRHNLFDQLAHPGILALLGFIRLKLMQCY